MRSTAVEPLSKLQSEKLGKLLLERLTSPRADGRKVEIFAESVSSIYLDVGTKVGGMISTATGALVRNGSGPTYLVTNRHVVTGLIQGTGQVISKTGAVPDAIHAMIPTDDIGAGQIGWWGLQISLYDDEGRPLWFEHPQLGPKADIVALTLPESSSPSSRFAYDLAKQPVAFLSPGEILSVVGYPFGKTVEGLAVWATGFVASEPGADYDQLPIMLVDCRSRPGQSGSPVIFSRLGGMVPTGSNASAMYSGRVTDFVGIYSGRINQQSDIGMVWKRSAIVDLVDSLTASNAQWRSA